MCRRKNDVSATPESRKALYENAGRTIEMIAPVLKSEALIKKSLEADSHKVLDALLSLDVFCQYIQVELGYILRTCLKAELIPEKRYSIKYINCVIYEAYKNLYGFGNARSKFWKSNVRDVLRNVEESQFREDLNLLEERIIRLANDKIADKNQRNLSFHYDPNPLSVYEMLMRLGEESEFQRLICFLDVIVDISKFIRKYIKQYAVKVDVGSDDLFSFSDIDVFKGKKDEILFATKAAIEKYSQMLDDFVKKLNLLSRLKQQIGQPDSGSTLTLDQMSGILKAVIQICYIYIDLASASRAFIGSEHILEKQLSMKQINTIFYEGFNKIYGLGSENEESFWARYIVPLMSEEVNETIQNEFDALCRELESLRAYVKTRGDQRELAVHYKDILAVYDNLHNLNPLVEFQKALLFLELLPRLLDFFTKCLSVIDQRREAEQRRQDELRGKMIDDMLTMLNKAHGSSEKQKLVELLTKIKTGEFFEEIFQKHNFFQA